MRAFLLFGEQSQRMEPTPIQLYIIYYFLRKAILFSY